MTVTLKDVATLAGVSVKTVSNVVNGYAFVKPENRRRVEEALAATGYRPNVGARNLRRGRTGFLALMVPELSIPYFGELAGLVITAAQKRGWSVLIEQTQGTRVARARDAVSLGPHLVDGALVHPEALEAADFPSPGEIPLVMLGEHAVDVPIDHVAIDNVLAAQTAVSHLASLGRTRIAAIGRNPSRGTSSQRLAGYRAALGGSGTVLFGHFGGAGGEVAPVGGCGGDEVPAGFGRAAGRGVLLQRPAGDRRVAGGGRAGVAGARGRGDRRVRQQRGERVLAAVVDDDRPGQDGYWRRRRSTWCTGASRGTRGCRRRTSRRRSRWRSGRALGLGEPARFEEAEPTSPAPPRGVSSRRLRLSRRESVP